MTEAQRAAEAEGDLFSNKRFSAFRSRLEGDGFTLKLLWSAKTGHYNSDTGKPYRYDNLGFFAVCGPRKPKVTTFITVSYGKDGFGLWLDSCTNNFDDDVAAIVGQE